MVTEGFDDERENVDELWGFDVFWLKIVKTLLTFGILCMNNVKHSRNGINKDIWRSTNQIFNQMSEKMWNEWSDVFEY